MGCVAYWAQPICLTGYVKSNIAILKAGSALLLIRYLQTAYSAASAPMLGGFWPSSR